MTTGREHADAYVGLLRGLIGEVETREMMGTVGLYLDGAQFGLLSDGRLLFRTDAQNRDAYEAYADPVADPFCPRGQIPGDIPWRAVPGPILDRPEALRDWALSAWEAAKRARKALR